MPEAAKVLILTPVKDREDLLETYFANLAKIDYPHGQISLGFLEGDSRDASYAILRDKRPALERQFAKVGLWKKDFDYQIPAGAAKWAGKIQQQRRAVLAKSRNHLLFRALADEDWVLWLDVDVVEYPRDIIEQLLATGKEIVHPNCVRQYGGESFDRNAWRDKKKYHLDTLRDQGELVELHAVGGTMLLIKADIHRDGLVFPTFMYGKKNSHMRRTNFFFANWREMVREFYRVPQLWWAGEHRGEIETEGLGMMAHDMGYRCWGLPHVEIRHY